MPQSPNKGKVGRPSKFTPENREIILRGVKLGSPDMMAPQAAGLDYSTVRKWLVRGEAEKDGPYFEFFLSYKKARGERVNRWLGLIEDAAPTSWQAAAWKLERLYPMQFGRSIQRTEHIEEKREIKISIDMSVLSIEELRSVETLSRKLAVVEPVEPQRIGSNGNGEAEPD